MCVCLHMCSYSVLQIDRSGRIDKPEATGSDYVKGHGQ